MGFCAANRRWPILAAGRPGRAAPPTWRRSRRGAYGHDLNNELTSAVEQDSHGNLITQVTLFYDVFGQLVEEDTTTNGQTTVQRFAYDAEGNAWADLDGSDNLLVRRAYAAINGQAQAVARETVSGGSATSAAWPRALSQPAE